MGRLVGFLWQIPLSQWQPGTLDRTNDPNPPLALYGSGPVSVEVTGWGAQAALGTPAYAIGAEVTVNGFPVTAALGTVTTNGSTPAVLYQRQIPGGAFANETTSKQAQIPGGAFLNDSATPGQEDASVTYATPNGFGVNATLGEVSIVIDGGATVTGWEATATLGTVVASSALGAHRYWRVNITSNNGDDHLAVAEFQFRTVAGTPLLFSGGTASASAVFSAYHADHASANDGTSSYWDSGHTGGAAWWKYDYGAGNEKQLAEVTIQATLTPATAPQDFTVEYSDDDSNWYTAYTATLVIGWTSSEIKTFTFANQYNAVPRLTQAIVEALRNQSDRSAYLAQIPVEALRSGTVKAVLDQNVIEVLRPNTDTLRVTQLVAESIRSIPAPGRVSQLTVEAIRGQTANAAIDQLVMEVIRANGAEAPLEETQPFIWITT